MVTRERKGALRQESRKLIFVLVTGYITKFIDHKVSITKQKLCIGPCVHHAKKYKT